MITLSDVGGLPPTIDGRLAADVLGCSYWSLLEQVKAGTCPVEPLRLGARLRWSTVAILRAVGIDPLHDEGAAPTAAPVAALTNVPATIMKRGHADATA